MPKKLNQQDLTRYRRLLEHIRAEISGDIDDLAKDAFSDAGVRGSVDNPADIGSDSFAQEFSLELLQRDEATLKEVLEALERIREGRYGVCETCDQPIPRGRLSAVPHARNCIDCQRAAESAP